MNQVRNMETDIFDLDQALSAKLYEMNSLIIQAGLPSTRENYIPGAKDFHPMVRPYLYGQL